MSIKVITSPATEPITLTEAKVHLRVDGTDEDALITSLIVAARQGAEHLTGRALMTQTLEFALDGFADKIKLPRPPFVSVTSFTYVDMAGDTQTLFTDGYVIDSHSEPARIVRPYGVCWPSTRCQPGAVLIRYQAGYTDADAVPDQIKSWMLLRIGMFYANRESVVTGTSVENIPHVDRLLDAYRTYI